MGAYSGQNLYVEFGGVDISLDFRTFSWDDQYNDADSTAGGDVDEEHILTTRSVEFSFAGVQQTADGSGGSAVRNAIRNGAQDTIIVGPEGTAAGKPKYSCVASVTGNSISYPYADVVTIDATFKRNGAWIEHYEDSGDTW